MELDDRTFYFAIIAACIVGIAIVATSILTSEPYEEQYSELYFYGEKLDTSIAGETFLGYDVHYADGQLTLGTGDARLGPLFVGGTVVLDGGHWNVEDASDATGELLMRAVPSTAAPGEDVAVIIVIANHEGTDHTYECIVSTADTRDEYGYTVAEGDAEQIRITVTVPSPPEEGEPIGEYDEVFQSYVRHVVDYGEFKHVAVEDEAGLHAPYWRTRVSVSLDTGNTIYFWLRLDDE